MTFFKDKRKLKQEGDLQFILTGISLFGINIGLMVIVGMYWLNPTFHTFLTGKPF